MVDDIIATDGIESHQGFESTDAINEYLAANPNSTQHAILFECASSCAYEVTSNVTVCLSPGACTTTSTPWVPASKQSVCFGESLACTGPPQVNTCNGLFFPCSNTSSVFRNVSFSNATDDLAYTYAIQYNRTQQITVWDENINLQTTVVLPLKVAADRAILRQVTGDSEAVLNIRTTIFPRPELITFDVVAAFGPVFFFAALMFNFVIQMGQVGDDRDAVMPRARVCWGWCVGGGFFFFFFCSGCCCEAGRSGLSPVFHFAIYHSYFAHGTFHTSYPTSHQLMPTHTSPCAHHILSHSSHHPTTPSLCIHPRPPTRLWRSASCTCARRWSRWVCGPRPTGRPGL